MCQLTDIDAPLYISILTYGLGFIYLIAYQPLNKKFQHSIFNCFFYFSIIIIGWISWLYSVLTLVGLFSAKVSFVLSNYCYLIMIIICLIGWFYIVY